MIVRKLHRLSRCIDVSSEVKYALESNKPIVALESTIITHGMPYPHNKQTAFEVEQTIRDQNVLPATIGIIEGRLKIGLSPQEITFLSSLKANDVVKTSRRDFPFVLSQKLNGGTTVSGTMVAAHSAGIKVFVTGGVGGVHRGGEQSMDVSADLTELGRTPVAVVCSGVKSILDIGRTLEYLETQGVCVAAYGPTKEFPAFYCQRSGHQAPYNVSTPEEAAKLVHAQTLLGLQTGVLFAVPVPQQHVLIDEVAMESAIQTALKKADEQGIKGKAVTPFVLQYLSELTKGKSLQTNIALIKHNALIGAQIAAVLSTLSRPAEKKSSEKQFSNIIDQERVFAIPRATKPQPVVVGASIVDSVTTPHEPLKLEGRTLKGRIRQSGGGVGRNLADALGKLGTSPTLVTAVGNDQHGRFLLDQTLNHLERLGVLVSDKLPTASYTVLLDERGEFRVGVGDMEIHSLITPDHIGPYLQEIPAVIMDGNIPVKSMFFIMEHCAKYGIPVIFEPTDVAKAALPFHSDLWKSLHLITPNLKELRKIASFVGLDTDEVSDESAGSTSLEEVVSLASSLAEHIHTVLVTLGARGLVMVGRRESECTVSARYYPTVPLDQVLSVSGAGDCLAAGVFSGMLEGLAEPDCVARGIAAAVDSLHDYAAVPQQFSTSLQAADFTLVNSTVRRSFL